MGQTLFASLLVLAAACLETGCSFSPGASSAAELLPGWDKETVTITLPQYPAETHPPLAGWKIIHWKEGGSFAESLPAGQGEVALTMAKNIPTAILCYPLTTVDGATLSFFHPAGCIYPYSKAASWEEGFAAETFYQLARQKSLQELSASTLLRFNWPRLTQQTTRRFEQAREKEAIFSPWFLQEMILREAIQQGTASTRHIKQGTVVKVSKDEILGTRSHDLNNSSDLLYRYIPLGMVKDTIAFPQTQGYAVHQENAFLQENRIVSLFTKKNQKPVLATIGVERYTD